MERRVMQMLARALAEGGQVVIAPSALEPGDVRVLPGAVLVHDVRARDELLAELERWRAAA